MWDSFVSEQQVAASTNCVAIHVVRVRICILTQVTRGVVRKLHLVVVGDEFILLFGKWALQMMKVPFTLWFVPGGTNREVVESWTRPFKRDEKRYTIRGRELPSCCSDTKHLIKREGSTINYTKAPVKQQTCTYIQCLEL